MDKQHEIEKQIYIELFLNQKLDKKSKEIKKKETNIMNKKGYGYANHAKKRGIAKIVNAFDIQSICDVGCGAGGFCNEISNFCSVIYGVDFASIDVDITIKNDKIKYISAEAHDIPLPDNAVEFITSFDCLEHCLPQDIDKVFQEFNRIATKGYILTIAYRQSRQMGNNGELLHKTVQKKDWWVNKIKEHCPSISVYKIKKIEKRDFLLCLF